MRVPGPPHSQLTHLHKPQRLRTASPSTARGAGGNGVTGGQGPREPSSVINIRPTGFVTAQQLPCGLALLGAGSCA